jgi:hypothetical protein
MIMFLTFPWKISFSFCVQVLDTSATPWVLSYGLLGSLVSVPPKYSASVILSVGSTGITKSVIEWGAKLMKMYGKTRKYTDSDFGLNHLGYSTDNGAYYYYFTEPNMDYETTLGALKNYTMSVGLPVRHILLDRFEFVFVFFETKNFHPRLLFFDSVEIILSSHYEVLCISLLSFSWWYFRGLGGGVQTWEGRPDIFPNGMCDLYNKTQWPVVAHNRFWAPDTTYAKVNGGKWDFIVEPENNLAIPNEQVC